MSTGTTDSDLSPGGTNPRSTVIETTGLVKHFGDVRAVRGVDLAVPANSIFGFLGPNGAGKTTTIKMLVGLLAPTAGTARVLGLDAVAQSLALRRRVGFLPQHPIFYEDMSARQTLRYAGGFFGMGGGELEQRIDELLATVGLEGRADRSVAGFSGGERQRLGLAQAQLHDPDLLILDEPAAGLDPLGRRDVLALLEELRQHATVLYSTHILDDVQRVSDQVAILRKGVVIAQGPIESMLTGREDATTYRVELSGEAGGLADELREEPWIRLVETRAEGGHRVFYVGVADEQATDDQLLRMIVADPRVTVLAYGRHRFELEDVFVQLVEQAEAG